MKQLSTILLLILPFLAAAQDGEVPINSTNAYTGCGATLLDTGANPGTYQANENETITICPEDPETVINIYWPLFDLGTGDEITLYDGPDTGSPLIGTFTANDLQTQNTFSGDDNTSGCITVVFTSNADADLGNFAGVITCGFPCQPPIAAVETAEEQPILICPGESVTFDASPSTAAEGFEIISYDWDFDDGTELVTEDAQVEHTFEEEGGYVVQVTVTDNSEDGCTSNNLVDVIVLVSNEPDFSGTSTDVEICLGQEVDLTGAVTGQTWIDVPDANFGGELFIPDDQSTCFESSIEFTAFGPGATVESVEDIIDIFINFEHSYMGDLIITFICPNGQSMIAHQQGGGGTYLGEPIDDGSLDPGIGYDYYWAPDATNGTWEQEAGFGGTLPAGTYSSVQPFENLIGCPLNGNWTVEICDVFSIDNGFIFDWTINFNPELFPELATFTPVFGQECDSTFWTGPSITGESANCNDITVQPDELGTQTYTFNATNNHGCTYTQDVNVNVVPGPEVTVSQEEVAFCGDPLTISADATEPGGNYVWSWDNAEFLSDPDAPTTQVINLQEPTTFTVTIFPVGAPECPGTATVDVIIPEEPVVNEIPDVLACLGDERVLAAAQQPSDWDYNYEWTDVLGNVLGTNPSLVVDETGLYTVTVSMVAPCPYSASTTVDVEFEPCDLGEIPNIFSPQDGNTDNNSFFIENLDKFTNQLLVYNRWGTLVFEAENYNNNWSPAAEDVSDGTYFYILRVELPNGDTEEYSGPLTIARQR
jgi:subtilisin-like proprotein convertase family protein